MRRHSVPRVKPGVVDTFFCIRRILQNILCNGRTVCTIFHRRLADRCFVPVPVHLDNMSILHMEIPPFIYHHAVLKEILHFSKKICDAVVHALRCCIFCIIFLVAIDLKKSVTKATPFHPFIFFMPESVLKPLRVFLSQLLPLPDPCQVLCSIL